MEALSARGFVGLLTMSLWVCQACDAHQAKSPQTAPPAAAAAPAPATKPASGFDGQQAFAHVQSLVAIGPRSPGTEGIRRAQDYIRTALKSYGCAVDEDDFRAQTPIGQVSMKNIIAKTRGSRQEMILLMTHYDTKRQENFVGANDGGSSTGVMLELARHLCRRQGGLTVWIAFLDGEEAFVQWSNLDGTYGSRQLAARMSLSGDLKRIKAVILADLVGYRELRIRRDTASTPWLTDLVWKTAARLGYQQQFVDEELGVADDHVPFLARGVPAVDIIQLNDFPYWHTPQDTLDKISPRSLGVVGHVILELLPALESR